MCVCVCVFVCVMSVRLCNCHLLQLLANVLSVSLCMAVQGLCVYVSRAVFGERLCWYVCVCERACDHIRECFGKVSLGFKIVSVSVRVGGWICVRQCVTLVVEQE